MNKKNIRYLLITLVMFMLVGCSSQKYTKEQYLQDYELLKKDGFWEEKIATSFLDLITFGTKEEVMDFINDNRSQVKEDEYLTDKGRKVCEMYLDAYEKIYYKVEDVIGSGEKGTQESILNAIRSTEVTSLLNKATEIRDTLLD